MIAKLNPRSAEMVNKHQAIVDAFYKDLLTSRDMLGIMAHEDYNEALAFEALPTGFISTLAPHYFERPYLAFPDPIFGIKTLPGYIFDDTFWDVFHAHPLHVCHVTRLTAGPQFDEGRVFDIRFRVDERRALLK